MPNSIMVDQLLPILVLTVIVIVFGAAMIFLTSLAGPKRNPTPEKQMPFESGVKAPIEESTKYPVKFYLTAILFILFEERFYRENTILKDRFPVNSKR